MPEDRIENLSEASLKILEKAMPLFARSGFDGVSMRDIAGAVGVKAPALYNHFKDKQCLYLAVVSYAFANKSQGLIRVLSSAEPAEVRLRSFIFSLCDLMVKGGDFRSLLQRELLDGDDERLKILGTQVFAKLFELLTFVLNEINPKTKNVNMLAVTVIGMVRQHFELQPLYQFLPGVSDGPIDPEELSENVLSVIMYGIKG